MQKNYHLDESITRVLESPLKQLFGYGSLLLSSIFRWTIAKLAGSCKFTISFRQSEDVSKAQLKRNWKEVKNETMCPGVFFNLFTSNRPDPVSTDGKLMEKLFCLMEYICLNYILVLMICSEAIITYF